MFSNWFPESLSNVARSIDQLFWYSTAWTASVGVIVILILISFLIIYRQRTGRYAFYTHGDSGGAITLTLVLAFLVFILLDVNLAYRDHLVWGQMFGTPPSQSESLKIEIMPEQFAWNIRYAGADEIFGTDDDVVTMNDLHVPVNQPVIVQLSARDVIHSFFLPNLRIKQDAIPGMVTSIYFNTEKTGQFNIACAQHCGLGHYRMKGSFVVDEPADFKNWLDGQAKQMSDVKPEQWAWDWDKGLTPGHGPFIKKETAL